MISADREYLNVKGKQCQPIHAKRFHSHNSSLVSISQTPSLPQLKLQAKQFLSQSIHNQIIEGSILNVNHTKPLICKNKSCIYLVRTLEEKVAKCILRIKEIAKENNILRMKLQMDRQLIDSYIPSTHRSLKSTDFKQNIDEQPLRADILSIHDTYSFAKFHNESSFTTLTKPIRDIFVNLNFVEHQPILDCNWIQSSLKKLSTNKCQRCNSSTCTSLLELDCNHYYHKTCLLEHLIEQQNSQHDCWCACKKKINKNILNNIGIPEQAILKEMKYISDITQMILNNQTFYKCEQNSCSFVIITKDIESISIRSYCQSCLTTREFIKKEAKDK